MRILFVLILFTVNYSVNAATYYVDKINGNDNNSGLSNSQAWKSIYKVNSSVTKTGSDVYFKCGRKWKLEQLRIDWNGIASNRVVVGAYHMSNGSEVVGCASGQAKPVISGGYVDESKIGTIPKHAYAGLIDIRADYVTVQDFKVINSSAAGVRLASTLSVPHKNAIVQRIDGSHIVKSCIVFSSGSSNSIMRNNFFTKCGWPNATGLVNGVHPGGYTLSRSSKNLIEGNTIIDCACEGIVAFNKSNNNIIRANKVIGVQYVGLYADNASKNVFEHNLVVGDSSDNRHYSRTNSGISSAVEGQYYSLTNNSGNIFRNNLIANVDTCFLASIELDKYGKPTGKTNDFLYIGNTCVGAEYSVKLGNNEEDYAAGTKIANNIFSEISAGATSCKSPSSPNIKFEHNAWNRNPVDSLYCDGVGDVYGSPLSDAVKFLDSGTDDIPHTSDFSLDGSKTNIANDSGKVLTSTILSPADYPLITAITSPKEFTKFDLSELGFDFEGKTRHFKTPDIGGIEISDGNKAPVLVNLDNQTIVEGEILLLSVSANDFDGPSPLLLTQTNNLPGKPNILKDFGNGIGELYWPSQAGDSGGGPYTITVFAKDGKGASSSKTFRVNVDASGGGSGSSGGKLTGKSTFAPSKVNLSSEGTLDWVHWGLNRTSDTDRKVSGGVQFSDVMPLNGASMPRATNSLTVYSWSDGMPTSSVTNTNSGLRVYTVNKGFEFTVPADTTTKTLKIYVGAKNVSGRLVVALSDGSAPNYITQIEQLNGTTSRVVTINYQAAASGQLLFVRYILDSKPGSTGWISLESASLQGVDSSGGSSGGSGGGGSGGSGESELSGNSSKAPSNVKLSSVGALDWVHWGLYSALDVNRKTNGDAQISEVTVMGGASELRGTNSLTVYSWSGGSPISSVNNTNSGLRVYKEGKGFEFSIPVGTTMKTLKVYVGAKNVSGKFKVSISDGSVADYVTQIGQFNGTSSKVVTLNVKAASAGEKLTVNYTLVEKPGSTGWISLESAALE